MTHPLYLNFISFFGIFGLCGVTWLFSEHRRIIPWRVIIWGIGLQLVLGLLVFWFPPTKFALEAFSRLLDAVFLAADKGAQFIFGPDIVPTPDKPANLTLRGLFAFRNLPPVIFFSGLMALLYNLGVIQPLVDFLAKVFYKTMRLSGAEALSGSANIFVGIEAAIVVKPFIEKMTRSELCAILGCCFGTAASSVLAIYVKALQDVFPNILVHLVSASIIAIPACFVISKILVPETELPLTAGGIPQEEKFQETKDVDNLEAPKETVGGEPIERVSPMDSAILGALDGVKMSVSIAAVLILIIGFVSLINQSFASLAALQTSEILPLKYIGQFFSVVSLQNIEGVLFYPLTLLTGVPFDESWKAAVLIGRRLTETAIPSYTDLGKAAVAKELSDRTVLIVSYALSGFAHIASVGIFVGGTIALAPSRRKDITELGWKALFVGTLATMMIACIAGVFDTSDPNILGTKGTVAPTPALSAPSVTPSPSVSPAPTDSPSPSSAIPSPPVASAPSSSENQLLLDKARLEITSTDASRYNRAIDQASKIPPGDPLYDQARADIERWSRVIMDIAQGRAKQGNFDAAIEAANLVPAAHQPTYEQAQSMIAQWEKQSQLQLANQDILEQANGLMRRKEAESYQQAIALLGKIPFGEPKYFEAQELIGESSQMILLLAQQLAANGRVNDAITTAALVPENTPAYPSAQQAIAQWENQLLER